MKKIALALALALALGGCAQLQKVQDAVSVITTGVDNPVTPEKLDSAEAGLQLVITGLRTYKKACVQGIADAQCRGNIAAIQAYTRQIPPILRDVRRFVDENDQVNAIKVYRTLVNLVADMKASAANVGIKTEPMS